MKKKAKYCQCEFKKGNKKTTGFVAERAAKLGCIVELEINEEMVGGWEVTSVGKTVDKDQVRLLERQGKGLKSIFVDPNTFYD